jgi:NAD(P)H dehydrogenase (quinone)
VLVITGASGKLGMAVARHVAALRGGGAGLVLATRDPAAIDGAIPDAVVRRADFGDPAGLVEAFAGVERLLLVSTDDIAHRAAGHLAAIDAAVAAGARQVLYTSMLSPVPANPALIAASHRATEEHLRGADVAPTILRAGFYADFQVFEAAAALADGRLRHNQGTGRSAYLTREDIARSAATVLAEGGHEGETLELTGTEAFDAAGLARRYAEAGGREVRPEEIGDEELLNLLGGDADGHNQYGAQLTVSIGQAIRGGFLDIVTDTVRDLTGTAPEPLESVLARHADALRRAR